MSVEENKAVVRRVFEELTNNQNLDIVEELFVPNFGEQSRPNPAASDYDGIRRAMLKVFETFPDFHVTIDDIVGEGDKVAVRVTNTATHLGAWGVTPATGKVITWTSMLFYRMENGKIADEWILENALSRGRQMGVIPDSIPPV